MTHSEHSHAEKPLLVSPLNTPLLVSLDGNIGSGKSTTWELLKEAYKGRDDVYFVEEPVDSWRHIKDAAGVPILTNFYKDKQAYAFRFQMMAYISRLALLRQTVRKNAGRCRVIITERSVETDRNIFAKMLYDSGDIAHDEYAIYNMWFDEFVRDLPVAGLVYIRADPETCMQRITKRGREGESIPLEYIQKCHDYHEAWINPPEEQVCPHCNRTETECEKGAKNVINPITHWQGDGLTCDDCHYKRFPEEGEEDEEGEEGEDSECHTDFAVAGVTQTKCKKLVIDANPEIGVTANQRISEIKQFIDQLQIVNCKL